MTDPLVAMREEAAYFASYVASLQDDADVEGLIDRYLDWKGQSASVMRQITDGFLARDGWMLDYLRERLESDLRVRLMEVIPLSAITVPAVNGTHRKLFEYLYLHRGSPVSARRLRVLTGDQVHTERRVRDLRGLGFTLPSSSPAGDHSYELVSEVIDLGEAVRKLAPGIVAEIPEWSPARRARALESLGLAADPLPEG